MSEITVGKRIKYIRERKGISLVKLARISNVTAAYLSELENGVKNNPSFNVLNKIACALDVTISFLLDDSSAKAVGE